MGGELVPDRPKRGSRAKRILPKRSQWPVWRPALAAAFVVVGLFFVEAGVFPSQLLTPLPQEYLPKRILLTLALSPIIVPLVLGPKEGRQWIGMALFYLAVLYFIAFGATRNFFSRKFVEREMAAPHRIDQWQSEWRFVGARRASRGSLVAQFQSKHGDMTWHPASGLGISGYQPGRCVTLTLWRNENGVRYIADHDSLDETSLHPCPEQ